MGATECFSNWNCRPARPPVLTVTQVLAQACMDSIDLLSTASLLATTLWGSGPASGGSATRDTAAELLGALSLRRASSSLASGYSGCRSSCGGRGAAGGVLVRILGCANWSALVIPEISTGFTI